MRHWFIIIALALLLGGSADGGVNARAALPTADSSDTAWATIRAAVPNDQPLYRPTWLPPRFHQAGTAVQSGLEFGVVYSSTEGDRLLFGRTGNSGCAAAPGAPPAQLRETLLIHGVLGEMLTSTRPDCFPSIGVFWHEGGRAHSIQGNALTRGSAVSREELLFIVAGLAAVLPDGKPASAGPLNGRADAACFQETGQCAAGPFLAYWQANGGVARNGYPLTGEMLEQLEDGRIYQVQYFERIRLEWHPENADASYRVLLGQFGRRVYRAHAGRGIDPPVSPKPGATFFAETGHNVDGRFLAYWREQGGLAQFGFPLTEPIQEQLDGQPYTVQYFERARLEYHPENAAPYDILLGQFGRQILQGSALRPRSPLWATLPLRVPSSKVALAGLPGDAGELQESGAARQASAGVPVTARQVAKRWSRVSR